MFTLSQKIQSPDNKLELLFKLNEKGEPVYQLKYKNKEVVGESLLGLEFKEPGTSLKEGFAIESTQLSSEDETWEPVWGTQKRIRNQYNALIIQLNQVKTGRKLLLHFRLFDEGLAFRYVVPAQPNLNYFIVTRELTQFQLKGNHKAFWIPGDYDSQEYAYNETQLSEIDNTQLNLDNGIGFKGPMGIYRVQSPLMMKSTDGLYLNIFEAAVINYPVMHLDVNRETFLLTSHLVPNAIGDMAYLQAPAKTPWRTIMVTDDATKIVASHMILNLNEPNVLEDTSWIKPMKYVGIWWEMHVGVATWDYAGSQNAQITDPTQLKATGKHGATTENTKRYIDFAAKHGFDGVLVEGWNVGWEDWFGNWKEDVFDFVTPYPDFDIDEVNRYAKEKGVKMIMHHETSASVSNYERRLDRALALMKKYDYPAVKTGYVGRIIPRGEWHDGQSMVNHFNYVVERAAEHQIMVNSHESHRPTGLHRT
ncbi:MAG: glycoside hydrolase family 97 N-terminal domain-containing protein, partial [Flavobacterium sp.]